MKADVKLYLSDAQKLRLIAIARFEQTTPEAWLQKRAEEFKKQILGETDDVDAKEAARMLNLSRYTVARYFRQGLFPKAYLYNSRVIRIPRTEVEKFKASRRVSLQS